MTSASTSISTSTTTATSTTTTTTATTATTAPPPATSTSDTTSDDGPGLTTLIVSESSGLQCEDESTCTEYCFLLGILGGFCSECLTEDDCEWGCSPPIPEPLPGHPALCNNGDPSDGCNTSAACRDDFVCASLLDIPGVHEIRTCSECVDDSDCAPGLCGVDLRLDVFGGTRQCVVAGTVANGQTCDLEGSGDEACANLCAAADLGGIVEVGVCSECTLNAHCDTGETCMPPTITLDGAVTAGACG